MIHVWWDSGIPDESFKFIIFKKTALTILMIEEQELGGTVVIIAYFQLIIIPMRIIALWSEVKSFKPLALSTLTSPLYWVCQ